VAKLAQFSTGGVVHYCIGGNIMVINEIPAFAGMMNLCILHRDLGI